MWLFPTAPLLDVAAIAEGELVVAGLTADLGVGGVGVVAVVTIVGVTVVATPAVDAEGRFDTLPPLLVDEGRSFVHISATHCDHGSEDCIEQKN